MGGNVVIFRPGALHGSVAVPGDKSISHRALIAGARAGEPVRIAHLNPGRDVRATRDALAALGACLRIEDGDVIVSGGSLRAPSTTIDCMNSGSTARMLLGACSGANIRALFDGDDSLRRRPMEPVAAQLRAFGAKIETAEGLLPVRLLGTPRIETRRFILLAPSAQVKSALLFAGLFAGVEVCVEGDRGSRDHTERLLRYLGADIEWTPSDVRLAPAPLRGNRIEIAGDFSAAAFFITAAAITAGSAIVVRDVGVNPTRTGLLEGLRAMGAFVELRNPKVICGEPIADIAVEQRPLVGVTIGSDLALRAIDEIALLAIAAAFASGTTTIAGVGDLRYKESDRVAGIRRLLGAVRVPAEYERGTLRIHGGRPASSGGTIATAGDHRIAMATGALASAAGPLAIDDDASIEVSFPGFLAALDGLQKP
jgi:3-phosphoshikimate 1-carboxyvinyltransferase